MYQIDHTQPLLAESFFDLSPDLLGVFDRKGRFLQVNFAYEQVLGYRPEDLIGQSFEVITHPDDIPRALAGITQLADEGIVRDVKLRCKDVRGDLHWFEVSARQDDEGLIYVVSRNISDRVGLEEKSQQLEKKLSTTLSSMTDAFFMIDTDWRFSFINAEAEKTLDVESADILGKSLWKCFPGAVGSIFDREYHDAVATGVAAHFEAYFAPLSLWVEVHAYPSVEGLAVYFRKINHWVFTRRHMEILERSINASVNGVLIVDVQTAGQPIIFANAGFERITGYTTEETIGRNCRFLQGERTNPETRDALRMAIASGCEAHVVIENYRKDGTVFWNELYLSPVRDELGNLTHFIGIQNDISSLEETRQLLAYKTHHDALTGLPNRQLIADRIEQALNQVQQPGRVLAILRVDISNYRQLQERLGLAVVQEAILNIVNRLQSSLGATSTLGQLDSDQFAVLIPAQTKLGIEELFRSLRTCFDRAISVGDESLRMTPRFGAVYANRSDTNPHELLRRSQVALSHVGTTLTDEHAPLPVYNLDMEQPLQQQSQLRRGLRRALSEQSFTLAYQPLIQAISGQVIGVEVLMRWHDSILGDVPPAEFIPAAEAEGLIDSLTDLLIDKLVEQVRTVLHPFRDNLQFCINISPLSLNSQFPDRLRERLDITVLPPGSIELELTETVMLNLDKDLTATLNQLRQQGFSIAIDDFGTGYTGLSYLKNLPVDTLKIDRTFVQDVVCDGRDSSIVESIVHLAQNLKLKLVAEGVEHANQVHHLTKAGINAFQGYLFARPMSAEKLVSFLSQHAPRPGFVVLPDLVHAERSELLIVDPDKASGNALLRIFRKSPLSPYLATNVHQAFDQLEGKDFGVMLCCLDVRDPDVDQFLTKAKTRYPNMNILVLSGSVSVSDVSRIINTGVVFKYLPKPCADDQLLTETFNAMLNDNRR